ncbi:adenosine kinase [Ohtaekwangia koreensis]|jgi:sugar/nucleoside kinase (ribokinase family)|uniref:Sugar or nucleoside kinase, ribokinase family n=1 Tax=Ohtaekwangia koreensis TaxID=688867 RepID=A0A1T5L7R8_9BACT|nr:adenosine kinase [Ohtaekwangia koreensis]SKC71458.1 Sugar or nucleoside kinase, ribokinase family [Ohtaekwangia koreensis]
MSKKYNVYGIGNAIVDIVTEVDHDFFEKNGIEKGVMTLVDEKRQLELMKVIDMQKSKMTGGGSAGNTVVAINQFGGKSFYSCLVAHDTLGKFFLDDLKRNGVDTNLKYENCPEGHSGRCLVMTSPDAHRTMNTFLGVSSFLSPEQLDESAIKDSSYVYLEGYLVASPKGLEAIKEAKRIAEKNNVQVALTFSDPSMVKYFPKQMEEIVGASVDLLFCNDEEAMIFTGTSTILEAREKLRQVAKRFVITLGANGALIFDGDTFIQIEPYKVQAIDTNGAGDMFAGAFLFGITHNHSYAEAGKLASLASSRVVTQWGPRLDPEQAKKILADLVA